MCMLLLMRVAYIGLGYLLQVCLFYTVYINVDIAHHEIFSAQVGKGGIQVTIRYLCIHIHVNILSTATVY